MYNVNEQRKWCNERARARTHTHTPVCHIQYVDCNWPFCPQSLLNKFGNQRVGVRN